LIPSPCRVRFLTGVLRFPTMRIMCLRFVTSKATFARSETDVELGRW
jgi:hypothetical protein